jgi:uncharacterized protein (DUF488 family)
MSVVSTIGYTRKSLERFIQLLQQAGVDAVIDVRLRNTSQLAGFSKRDDLAFLLREGFSIAYEHRPDLAPTAEIRDVYRENGDWPAYETAFNTLLVQREADRIGQALLDRYQRPCLLCAEPTPERCHRRLVAEWWAAHLPDVEVKHLVDG